MKKLILALAMVQIMASALVLTGCATRAQDGALIGGGIGAGTGAIIGGTSGHTAGGAVIGGAIGAVSGAVIGNQMDQQRRQDSPATHNVRGHYENRTVRNSSGETYEERVWVPNR